MRRPRDQPAPDLELELRDLLRDGGLADVELLGGPGERAAPGDGGEGAQAGVQLHSEKL